MRSGRDLPVPRRPVPTVQKLRRGETRPSRVNLTEPLPPLIEPVMPGDLSDEASAVWARIRAVAAPGLITASDEFALEAVAVSIAEARAARRVLDVTGPVIRSRSQRGIVASPASRVALAWQAAALAWCRELGLTPSSRSSIRGEPGDAYLDLIETIGLPPRLRVVGGEEAP
jgi:P27 family predicted phage terminase small subunit